MNIELEREKLNKILVDFYTLAHVRTVIYDSKFTRIAAFPEKSCDFCMILKSNPKSKALCRNDDKNACKICSERNNLYIYECHAGLVEAVAPIRMNDLTLGYIMFGQVRRKERTPEKISEYALQFAEDTDLLSEAIKNIKVRSNKHIEAISSIMEACTCYLLMEELIKIDSANLIYKLSDYITNNISGDLSVDKLCSVLKVSRVGLYSLSNHYYGMSIAKYIRKKRVFLAAEMLKKENSSVKEAAYKVGFYDGNYFSKVFKEEMGINPTDYKKK